MSTTECVAAAREYVVAASLVAKAAARHAASRGAKDLSDRHMELAISCAKRGEELTARLDRREPREDDVRVALDAICLAGEVVRACQDALVDTVDDPEVTSG